MSDASATKPGACLAVLFIATGLAGCFDGPDPKGPASGGQGLNPGPGGNATFLPGSLETGAVVFSPVAYPGAAVELLSEAAWMGRTGQPLPVPGWRSTGHLAFEPTIGVTPDGDVIFGIYQGSSYVLRSTDGMQSWKVIGLDLAGTRYPPSGSGDPLIHVDPVTGRIFNVQMYPATFCNQMTWSDDGKDWSANPIACGHPIAKNDHPTLWTSTPGATPTVGYGRLVHLCANRIADTACTRSLDGGQTFEAWRPNVFAGLSDQGTGVNEGSLHVVTCTGLTGHGVEGPDGSIYLARGGCGPPEVAVSQDDGMTWTSYRIADEPRTTLNAVNEPGVPLYTDYHDHEVALAVDTGGAIYALWVAGHDGLPYISSSADNGRSWSTPLLISPPQVRMTWFPTLVAGAEGRIAAVYYGTESVRGWNEMGMDDHWNVYATFVHDTMDDPIAVAIQMNPYGDPAGVGVCARTRCPDATTVDQGVGDFIDAALDADGRLLAAVVDTCTGPCLEWQHTTAGVGVVAATTGGYSLTGASAPDLRWVPQAPETFDGSGTSPAGQLHNRWAGIDVNRLFMQVYPGASNITVSIDWTAQQGTVEAWLWAGEIYDEWQDGTGHFERTIKGPFPEGRAQLYIVPSDDAIGLEWTGTATVRY